MNGMPLPYGCNLDDPDICGSELVYHYTTPGGFLNIIRSNCRLWASDHRFLNDAAEVNYGVSEATALFKKGIKGLPEDVAKKAITELQKPVKPQYVACFSDTKDSLSQWRAYGGNGRGYCLGLRVEKLLGCDANDPNAAQLLKCEYTDEAFLQAVSTKLEGMVQQYYADQERPEIGVLIEDLAVETLRQAVRRKHEHFRSEREYRLWITGRDMEEYREGKDGCLVPYRVTAELPLEEVWIGPGVGPSAELAKEAMEGFLRSKYPDVRVKVWQTTYRP